MFLDKPAIILTKFSNRILGKEALFFSGGFDGKSGLTTLEVIGDSNVKLPPLPEKNHAHSMVITNNNELMTLGGNYGDKKQCYKLVNGKWQKQNPLTQPRKYAVGITMADGIYVFGGLDSPLTSDFLPNGQSEWQAGPAVPEPGIKQGHGVAISPTELLLVGGATSLNKIMKYKIGSRTSTEFGSLLQGRYNHSCFFLGGKVVVTGGYDDWNIDKWIKSTEIINLSDGTSRKVGDLNVARDNHGMGIAHINGKSKLIVFGGFSGSAWHGWLDSIEEWDEESETWKTSTMKLSEANCLFGYCQIPSF